MPVVPAERRSTALVVVHGGVDMEPGAETVAALVCAAGRGLEVWNRGADALDAATAALSVLEDDPAFNAGFGSVLTREGTVETDGAVADGRSGRFAGVAAVPGLRHPALLARHLLEEGDTVLLVGAAASAYGEAWGLGQVDLRVEEQVAALAAAEPGRSLFTGRVPVPPPPSETVGCIVVTPDQGVVAASSTGGLRGKRAGRVGDAAVPGAGYWADGRIGVLCSGSGEAALKTAMALRVAEKAAASGVAEATRWAVMAAARTGAVLAVLAVDAVTGEVAAAHSGASFPVVVHDGSGATVVSPVALAEASR
jgi:beta-aspartyl-peptidase (threonine type)